VPPEAVSHSGVVRARRVADSTALHLVPFHHRDQGRVCPIPSPGLCGSMVYRCRHSASDGLPVECGAADSGPIRPSGTVEQPGTSCPRAAELAAPVRRISSALCNARKAPPATNRGCAPQSRLFSTVTAVQSTFRVSAISWPGMPDKGGPSLSPRMLRKRWPPSAALWPLRRTQSWRASGQTPNVGDACPRKVFRGGCGSRRGSGAGTPRTLS